MAGMAGFGTSHSSTESSFEVSDAYILNFDSKIVLYNLFNWLVGLNCRVRRDT